MLTRRENQTSTLLPGSAQKYNPNLTGGGCYITPDMWLAIVALVLLITWFLAH